MRSYIVESNSTHIIQTGSNSIESLWNTN